MWKVVQDRVPTLVELAKCCCGSLTSSLCLLCSKALEPVEHVFCHCGLVWKVWMKWVAMWNLHLVVPSNLHHFVLMWESLPVKSFLKEF
ncbi:hypothetical protein V6N12_032735 [Hibiscus sabdariffa]|uniref:Reverse transcriptase zinc-binding domain-containing protein n=1 Tax=Hibiscus sabdariffa TaxID=183260 RepID=A0ABR1ZKH0_9ROSI